jgi:hypothetical protein
MNDRSDTRTLLQDYSLAVRDSIIFFGTAIRRHLVAFVLIILASCAAGIAYWYLRTPYYESELVCRYINQPSAKKVLGEMIQKLNVLAQNGSSQQLARQLGLSPQQAARIIAIEPRNRAGSPLYEDITEEYQPIYIRLKATDNKVFGPAEAGIIRYLSRTDYQRQMAAAQLGRYTAKIDYLLGDIQKVDSITAAFTSALRTGAVYDDTTGLAHHFNIRAMLDYKDMLEEKLINLERQRTIDSGASVVVMHGFVPADKPSRGSRKVIAAFGIFGLLAAMGWAVLRSTKHEPYA